MNIKIIEDFLPKEECKKIQDWAFELNWRLMPHDHIQEPNWGGSMQAYIPPYALDNQFPGLIKKVAEAYGFSPMHCVTCWILATTPVSGYTKHAHPKDEFFCVLQISTNVHEGGELIVYDELDNPFPITYKAGKIMGLPGDTVHEPTPAKDANIRFTLVLIFKKP